MLTRTSAKTIGLGMILCMGLILACGGGGGTNPGNDALISEDFEAYSSFPTGDWTCVIDASDTGSWDIASDGGSKRAHHLSNGGGAYPSKILISGASGTLSDLTITAKVKPGNTADWAYHGILARFDENNKGNGYALTFTNQSASSYHLVLYYCTNGLFYNISGGDTTFTYNSSTYYTMKMMLSGTSIKCYIDDVLLIDTTDSNYSSGKEGIISSEVDDYFDDFVVTSP